MADAVDRLLVLRQQAEAKRQVQAEQTRAFLADAGLLGFANEARELYGDAKLTFAKFGDAVIGKEPERGYTDFVLLDLENKRLEAARDRRARQASKKR